MLRPARPILAALLAAAVAVLASLLPAAPASAHNSLVSSDPADGAALATAPTQITWQFDNPVPLDTLTVTLIDASGARSELPGSTHGPEGESQVVTPLPPLPSGAVSLRWRLVGPDGHPVTGRVDITLTAPAPTSVAPVSSAVSTAAPVAPTPATTLPPGTTAPAPAVASTGPDDGASPTPSALRWILRFTSYAAIIAVVGILLVSATVWPGAATHPLPRRVLGASLLCTAGLGVVQLLVVASDVSGDAPWASLGSVDAATTTYAGMAMALRVALALALWIVLFRYRIIQRDVYWTAVSLPAIGLLGTWAFAGHSRSMRWPAVGVVTDVAHHAAAATWIAGLAITAWIVIPHFADDARAVALRRFSGTAAVSVGVLVATGAIQTFRLTAGPSQLFAGDHGRYLLVKLVALSAMLALATVNRRRLTHDGHGVARLRQTVLAEFGLGVAIIGITAALVVSPPATGETEPAAQPSSAIAVNYTM